MILFEKRRAPIQSNKLYPIQYGLLETGYHVGDNAFKLDLHLYMIIVNVGNLKFLESSIVEEEWDIGKKSR